MLREDSAATAPSWRAPRPATASLLQRLEIRKPRPKPGSIESNTTTIPALRRCTITRIPWRISAKNDELRNSGFFARIDAITAQLSSVKHRLATTSSRARSASCCSTTAPRSKLLGAFRKFACRLKSNSSTTGLNCVTSSNRHQDVPVDVFDRRVQAYKLAKQLLRHTSEQAIFCECRVVVLKCLPITLNPTTEVVNHVSRFVSFVRSYTQYASDLLNKLTSILHCVLKSEHFEPIVVDTF